MAAFIMNWFETKNEKEKKLITSNQRLTFTAYSNFCETLFLLLQEIVRATPLTPKPLIGIYNWYLQRDTIISQVRSNTQQENSSVIRIELMNGEMIEINKAFLDTNQVLSGSEKWNDMILKQIKKSEKPVVKAGPAVKKRSGLKPTMIITEPVFSKPISQAPETFRLNENFDYAKFHKKLVEQREDEKQVDLIANLSKRKKKEEIKNFSGKL
jgi:hypothetical protein